VDRGSLGIVLMVGSAGAAMSSWSGGRDLKLAVCWSHELEAKAYRIRLDRNAMHVIGCKSLDSAL
jgi:hypothetical protein